MKELYQDEEVLGNEKEELGELGEILKTDFGL